MEDYTILVVEDNNYMRQFIIKTLLKKQYHVYEAGSGIDAIKILGKYSVDLILLDLGLGDMDGTEILEMLRRQNLDIPIIIISSIEEIDTKVKSFELGCDDYLTKPFYKEELLARIKRNLTKVKKQIYSNSVSFIKEMKVGPFTINAQKFEVYKNNTLLTLNKKLYDLFLYFIQHKGQVLSRDQIYTSIWDFADSLNENTLSVHIHMLRSQIEDDYKNPVYLRTIKGLGFIFSIPE